MAYYRPPFIYPQNYTYIPNIPRIKKKPLPTPYFILLPYVFGHKKTGKEWGSFLAGIGSVIFLPGELFKPVVQWVAPASSSHASAVPPKDRRPVAG